MSLRYKGKPDRSANKQYDALPNLCTCRFVAVGFSMDGHGCKVHTGLYYPCDQCSCGDYRPNAVKKFPNHWPRCVCGHIAQEHNDAQPLS